MKFLIALVVAVSIPSIFAYSSGAPATQCESMTPKHGPVQPQKSAAPYDITLSKKSIRSGDTISITIKGKTSENVIKGVLVQARVGETPIGKFDVSPSQRFIQLLDCGTGKGNAITHKKIEQDITEVKFNWTAPKGLSEKVVFVATVAQNGGVFWVKIPSSVLTINK